MNNQEKGELFKLACAVAIIAAAFFFGLIKPADLLKPGYVRRAERRAAVFKWLGWN